MAKSPYFNQYTHPGQQNLLESLIIQSIKIYGFDTYYLPRTLEDLDPIFREATVSSYNDAHEVEMYIKSMMGFEGDGKFMSNVLGYEIRDSMTWTVAQSRFRTATGLDRPREGDLVYLPLDKKVYEIKFVDHQAIFYQLGKLQTYDLQCELLEFAGEIFDTGVSEIDAIDTTFQMDGTENDTIEDWIDQSSEIQDETPGIVDFTEEDPFSQGGGL